MSDTPNAKELVKRAKAQAKCKGPKSSFFGGVANQTEPKSIFFGGVANQKQPKSENAATKKAVDNTVSKSKKKK